MSVLDKINDFIEKPVTELGYEIVRISLFGTQRQTLQIMIDRLDGKSITLGDCEKVSRLVAAIMDVEDPIEAKYSLQVSSPGIDRPLVKIKDFERYIGYVAEIHSKLTVNARKKFTGRIEKIAGNMITLKLESTKESYDLDFSNIQSAKLVLNDELIAKTQV